MCEYIERKAAIAAAFSATSLGNTAFRDVYDTVNRLRLIPAADVVPVVRCKDCRHIHTGKDVYYCRYWERWGITPNGFCSSGVKMGLEETE